MPLLLLTVLLFALPSPSCLAQGMAYMVKPMVIECTPKPGEQLERIVEVQNNTTRPLPMQFRVVLLEQSPNGDWVSPEPNPTGPPAIHSGWDWITSDDKEFTVPPMQSFGVPLHIKVPPTARGFYSAALLVGMTPPKDSKEFLVLLQFRVNVLIHVQGRAIQSIKLTSANMAFIPADAAAKQPKMTRAIVGLTNTGETCPRIGGQLTVLAQVKDVWRRVTTSEIATRSIMPGAKLELPVDVKRSLPTGKYKLQAAIVVDGRNGGFLEQEIDFVGDPTVTALKTDASLIAQPSAIEVKGFPGGTRSATLTLQNPTDSELQIKCLLEMPASLGGVMIGNISGDSYSAAKWTVVTPDTLTLKAGERRSIRVNFTVPDAKVLMPNSYANLNVVALFPDGQNAGSLTIPVRMQNTKAASEPNGTATQMQIVQDAGNNYIVTACFSNVGNVHLIPDGKVILLSPGVGTPVLSSVLETPRPYVLPMGTPRYAGVLDFSSVKAGAYLVRVIFNYGDKLDAVQSIPVKVEDKDGQKLVTIIDDAPPAETAKPAEGAEAPPKAATP